MAEKEPEKFYDREDSSAWRGDATLAYVTGLVSQCLTDLEAQNFIRKVRMPQGYAPVIDLVLPSGKVVRLKLEALEE